MKESIILIGYSGHAHVAHDCLQTMGKKISGYCELSEKRENPFNLKFLGSETDGRVLSELKNYRYFIAIGDNAARKKAHLNLKQKLGFDPEIAIHSSAVVSQFSITSGGVLVAPNAVINAGAVIEEGTICNTSCIIEHGCKIGKFSHIAPGAVLCGNVEIGEGAFVGANSVVKEGIRIGKNVVIGAGTVVIEDVSDNLIVAGNPQRELKK